MRPAYIHGPGRRAGPCAGPGHSLPDPVDAVARQGLLSQRPVGSVRVVVVGVLAEHESQVPLGPGCLDGRLDDPHAGCGEHRVERGGELDVPVADQASTARSAQSCFARGLPPQDGDLMP